MTPTDRLPTGAQGLVALAERVEALTGPDREVDALIACADPKYGPFREKPQDDGSYFCGLDWKWIEAPEFTESLDAALTLVPEGWMISQIGEWEAAILREKGPICCIVARRDDRTPFNPCWDTRCDHAATFPLALTAAALRARAAQAQDGEGGA